MGRNQIKSILEQDEKILHIIKPVKSKILLNLVFRYIKGLGWGLFLVAAMIISSFFQKGEEDVFDPERIRYVIGISLAIAVGAVTLIFIGILINELLDYRNRHYAVTNQRFIIQHGTISVGHISLYTKTIITLSIDVNIADKLLKKGTGSISFGTGSTKLRGSASDFRFDDIPDVYKNYKRFKKISDSHPEKEVETSVLG